VSRSVRFVGAWFVASAAVVGLGAAPATAALGDGQWSPPVTGPVVRGFDPPDTVFGPGHLGVDFAVAPGTGARAAGDGIVVFAGAVGAGLHVVVRHAGDVRTTVSFLATIAVVVGEVVRRGAILGTTGGTGPGHASGVLHFGVRVGATYVDPMLLFGPPDLAAVVHLAEPRHGAGSGSGAESTVGPSGTLVERAALLAELRMDGTPGAAPPPWWNDAWNDAPIVIEGSEPVRAKPAGVITAARPPPGSSGAAPAVVAAAVVSGAVVSGAVGGVTARRRRRRGPGRPPGAADYTAPRPGSSGPSEPRSPLWRAMHRNHRRHPPVTPRWRPRNFRSGVRAGGSTNQGRRGPWPSWKRRSQPS
jgi:Peptidase family M23